MINFEFDNEQNNYKVTFDSDLRYIFNDLNDIFVKFTTLGGEETWDNPVIFGNWYSWHGGGTLRWNIEVYSKSQGIIFEKKYNSLYDGDKIEKLFTIFCKKNKNTKGLVVGSHNGNWGHWVQPVIDGDTECIIVEGSKKQYSQLEKTYSGFSNCILINQILTVDGNPVEWYTGGMGFTDSVRKSTLESCLEEKEINKEYKETKNVNELITENNYQDFNWLHTDVEGYDAELIMGLKYLPELIVFENMHIKKNGEYDKLINYLRSKSYKIIEFGIDSVAIK